VETGSVKLITEKFPSNKAFINASTPGKSDPSNGENSSATVPTRSAFSGCIVNLILFAPDEIDRPLSRLDPRAKHILTVLRRSTGDLFDVGLIDGPRGKAALATIGSEVLTLTFTWGSAPPPLDPITLIVGLPRPQTARKILQEVTALGVAALHFVVTEKGEPNYGLSTLWSTGEWRRHAIRGAEQAFCTRLPEVTQGRALADVLSPLPGVVVRVALDNYESSVPLAKILPVASSVTLAVGGERGWSAAERDQLRATGFTLTHLGPRVLRVETACVAAVAVLKARMHT
jgi:16S rRNA (uracil1498-N3)-methyltransferase